MSSFPLLVPLGFLLAASSSSAQTPNYPDFSDWTGISPVGLTSQATDILRLQDNVAPKRNGDNRGAAWYSTAVNVVNGFDTTFTYRMHTPSTAGGSDGLAFVIQNDQVAGVPMTTGYPDGTGNTALGRHAAACGYGMFVNSSPGESVDNAVAIHLDTYNNGTWNDLDSNHISVHTGGNQDNSQDENYSIGRVSPATNLNDGAPHTVRVLYVPGTLEIYLDGNLELSVPYDFNTGGTWINSATPVGGLDLINGSAAYVGFTSGAGSAREFRDVLSWEFTTSGGLGNSVCFGDGSSAPCGCSNNGANGEGCVNSSGVGAILGASGQASLTNDTLVLTATQTTNQPGLFCQGDTSLADPATFGNGLRCCGTNMLRVGTYLPASSTTDTQTGNLIGGDGAPVSKLPGNSGLQAGDTRCYQWWYRDPGANNPCGVDYFNLSNAVELTWGA